MRVIPFLLLAATVASAQDTPGLEIPLKSPTAKRTRAEAKETAQRGRDVHEAIRRREKVEPEAIRQAIVDLETAIGLYEKTLRAEWDLETNAAQADCVRSWVALRKLAPPVELPTDPKEKARFLKKQKSQRKENLRDARRFVTRLVASRKYRGMFSRCPSCDGRGEKRTAFGDKSVCKTCRGAKSVANRKELLKAHWFAYTPLYRANGRHRAKMDYVLRSGVRGEKRIAPFILSYRVDGKIEEHGWWFRVNTIEKVAEEGRQKKGMERNSSYTVVKIGKVWWLHSGRDDRDLPIEEPEG
ncbi:MAG: hypothetical protein AAGD14_16710 [Planctomycetota bacterium]